MSMIAELLKNYIQEGKLSGAFLEVVDEIEDLQEKVKSLTVENQDLRAISSHSERDQRFNVERNQKWGQEIEHIPFIQFPAEWKIQVIPPFGDAVVRFRVQLPCGAEKSIYLDSRDSLGCFGEPYWEVHPVQDDVGRCERADVERLLILIADTTAGVEE